MRLTLRTLLAYMDGILDPADQEELARKVEASPEAKELVHRARDAMRRRRLEAPSLGDPLSDDTADSFDANAVAEYLDNTASPEAVKDFELECLKSDSYLAEVAACHHVLTMVLGERAKIDPETRRRMYGIPELAAAIAAGEAPAASPPKVEPADETLTEVPDYLRASRSPLSRWLPAVAALLLLGAVSYGAFRQGGWLRPAPLAMDDKQGLNQPAPPAAPDADSSTPGDPAADVPTAESSAEEDNNAGDVPVVVLPELPAELPAAEPSVLEPGLLEPNAVEPGVVTPVGEPPLTEPSLLPEQPAAPVGSESMTPMPGPGMPGPGLQPPVPVAPELGTEPADTAQVDPMASDAGSSEPAAVEPALPENPLPVGLLSSPQQVLLRYSTEQGDWQRLPVRTAVLTTDRLLSLPTYHPTVTLDSGLNVELVDGTMVEVGRTAPVNPPRLELAYGRLILTNASGAPVEVDFVVGDIEARLEIAARAMLAIESGRPFVAGTDPSKQQAPLQALLFAPQGGVTWTSKSGDLAVDSPGMWQIAGDSVGPVEAVTPEVAAMGDWIDGRDLSAWESEATSKVESQIAPGEPAWPQLMEIFGSKLKEQRALAAVSSAHVGHFDPFVKALGEEDLKPAWDNVVVTLRAAMARSPEAASGVRQALVDLRGEDQAADLYAMLCGYSKDQIGATPEQWSVGAMRQLVEWLGSPHLEYRVLANYNLEQITGRMRVFNPTWSSRPREIAVRKFETRLDKGDLVPRFAQE